MQRAALPFAANRIGQFEVELRSVERAFAGVDFEIVRDLFDGGFQRGLGLVPYFVRPDAGFGTGGELDVELFETEVFIDA